MSRTYDEISPKQLRAANGFLRGLTREQAMLKAGYSPRVAKMDPGSVFSAPKVKAYIKKRMNDMVRRNNITEDWIIERLAAIAGTDIGELLDVDEDGLPFINWKNLRPEMKAAIENFQEEVYTEGRGPKAKRVKKVKIWPKNQLKALELLGKHLGMFNDKVEISAEQSLIDRLNRGRERIAEEAPAAD